MSDNRKAWTAEVVAMRGLGDPDALPASDGGVRLAANQIGLLGVATTWLLQWLERVGCPWLQRSN